jgi:hypothetical protein
MKVTVVDGRTLLKWLEAANATSSTNWDEETSRLSELLVEQVTICLRSYMVAVVFQMIL